MSARGFDTRAAAQAECDRANDTPIGALVIVDSTGSRLALEHDPRDGRCYLTVTFDGHEAPFELDPGSASDIAAALTAYAAPVDTSALRFTGEPVKQGKAAVKTACVACAGNGRSGGWPCGGCGRS